MEWIYGELYIPETNLDMSEILESNTVSYKTDCSANEIHFKVYKHNNCIFASISKIENPMEFKEGLKNSTSFTQLSIIF